MAKHLRQHRLAYRSSRKSVGDSPASRLKESRDDSPYSATSGRLSIREGSIAVPVPLLERGRQPSHDDLRHPRMLGGLTDKQSASQAFDGVGGQRPQSRRIVAGPAQLGNRRISGWGPLSLRHPARKSMSTRLLARTGRTQAVRSFGLARWAGFCASDRTGRQHERGAHCAPHRLGRNASFRGFHPHWTHQRQCRAASVGSAATGDSGRRGADELGRLLRTVFLCDYFANPDLRRELHTPLNRGESVHQLQRAIYYERIAPERGRRQHPMTRSSLACMMGTHAGSAQPQGRRPPRSDPS